ncbi:LLM class flavin-dependent oxidoreductase [Lentzea tibetensis]|uniref:LLM class flavin-dependent oxidoreductase n=1 Tax=Lentzea tibetensis TaxID=2591470 RepID=A0A563EWL5_9PSEU|nr:LLM class flavin-dependent oxidoreductase [Lentzea tibetensis]TWP52090.1 LLM class flavin-dependent oxidoreductase [Lentzea tibetensis]
MTALGAVFRPQLPPERLRSVVEAADSAGLEQLWLWEDCFLESGIATAATALAWSSRLKVGVGLLPVPLRNVALAAMETATLHRLFPDRVIIGVGHGVQDWMGQVGARAESPLRLLREYLFALRALLRGERVTVSGKYVQLDGVALDWPPTSPAPVLAGGVGPKTIKLTGEAADGTIIDSVTSPDGLRAAMELIAEGGGSPDHEIVAYLLTATGEGAQERLDAEFKGHGVAGDAHAVAAAVEALAEAGAHTVVLQPTASEPDPEAFVRFAAEQVRPLVG